MEWSLLNEWYKADIRIATCTFRESLLLSQVTVPAAAVLVELLYSQSVDRHQMKV